MSHIASNLPLAFPAWTPRPLRDSDAALAIPAPPGPGLARARPRPRRPLRAAMRDLTLGLTLALAVVELYFALLA